MFRSSQTGSRQRQYPKAPGFNNTMQSSPTVNKTPHQQQWTGQSNWQASEQQYNNVSMYNPGMYGSQQHGHINQQPQQMQTAQGSYWQPQSKQPNADPWNWDVNNSNESTPNVQEQNTGVSWTQGNGSWDWQVASDSSNENSGNWNGQNQPQSQTLHQGQQYNPVPTNENQNIYNNHYTQQNLPPSVNDYKPATSQQPFSQQLPASYSHGESYYGSTASQPSQEPSYQAQQAIVPQNTPTQNQYSVSEPLFTNNDHQYSNSHSMQGETTQNSLYAGHVKPATSSQEPVAPVTAFTDVPLDSNVENFDVVDHAQNFRNFNENIYNPNLGTVTDNMKDLNLNEPRLLSSVRETSPPEMSVNQHIAGLNEPVSNTSVPVIESQEPLPIDHNPIPFKADDANSGHNLESDQNVGLNTNPNNNCLPESNVANTNQLFNNAEISSQQLYDQVEEVKSNAENVIFSPPSEKLKNRNIKQIEDVENQEVLLNGSMPLACESNSGANHEVSEIKAQEQFYEQREDPQSTPSPALAKNVSQERSTGLIQPRINSPFKPIYRSSPDIAQPKQVDPVGDTQFTPEIISPIVNPDLDVVPENQEKLHDVDDGMIKNQAPSENQLPNGDSPCATLWENPDISGNVTLALPSPKEISLPSLPSQQNAVIVPSLSEHQAVLDNPLGVIDKPDSPNSLPHVTDDIKVQPEVFKVPNPDLCNETTSNVPVPINSVGDGYGKTDIVPNAAPQPISTKLERYEEETRPHHDRENQEEHQLENEKYLKKDEGMRNNENYSDYDKERGRDDDRQLRDDDRRSQYDDQYSRYDRRSKYDDRDSRPREDRYYDRYGRGEREHRPRDLSSTRYGEEEESYERSSYHDNDRRRSRPNSRSRYEEEWRYRDSSRTRYDGGRYSRDHSPYDRQSRDHSRSRYGDYYNKDNYYINRHDDSQSRDRPPSRQNYQDMYRGYNYENDRRQQEYRRHDDYYRDRSGYSDQYERLARERDYLYRKYYDSYRMGNMGNTGAYNYGYFDELYNSDPRYREQIEKYKEYYSKRQGYSAADYDRTSVQSSGRNSVTNEIRQNESFSQEFQQVQSDSLLPYDLSSINADPSQNYSTYPEAYNTADEKLSPIEPVAQEPLKFTSPHVVANFSNSGQMVKVLPNDPRNGTPPTIEILETKVTSDETDMKMFPGPLIVGETHKNDVIQFCKNKLRAIQTDMTANDKDSACLIWEYLILMIRQNGSVAGTDIADLLLKDRSYSSENIDPSVGKPDMTSPDEGIFESNVTGSLQKVTPDEQHHTPTIQLQTSKIVDKFREYLLFGHKKDALEWAVRNGLWGHALFLASKMDKRTHAMIMMKFANSLQLNDPLQTLYQLMSGRQPASVTCCADEKWGDWRQHLAMILSNATNKVNVDRKSIATLGDTLATRGCLHAAHFCYLMAGSSFGSFSAKSSKVVLIGSSHQHEFKTFATNEAIQCTEVYEYAKKLAQPSFVMPHFQHYKFLYATRLLENGCNEEALHYCEVICSEVQKTPAMFSPELIFQLLEMASKLKFSDPHYTHNEGDWYELGDPQWIVSLNSINQAYKAGTIRHVVDNDVTSSTSSLPTNEYEATENQNEVANLQYQSNPQTTGYQGAYINYNADGDQQGMPSMDQVDQGAGQYIQNQQEVHQPEVSDNYSSDQRYASTDPDSQISNQNTSDQGVYGYPEYGQQWTQQNSYLPYNDAGNIQNNQENNLMPSTDPESTPDISSYDYYAATTTTSQKPEPRERRTSESSTSSYSRGRRDSHMSSGTGDQKLENQTLTNKQTNKKPNKNKQQAANGGGLFYGLFQKLSFRPKNQMILPDDKDPVIVWDDANQKWVNKDGEDENTINAPAAPPSDLDLSRGSSSMPQPHLMNNSAAPLTATSTLQQPSSQSDGLTGAPPGPNRFQRPKIKNMRANYVDVFGNKSQKTSSGPTADTMPTPLLPENKAGGQPAPNFFIPAPVSGSTNMDFISHNRMNNAENSEAPPGKQDETTPNTQQPGMTMFNPSDFTLQQLKPNMNPQSRLVHAGPRTYPR